MTDAVIEKAGKLYDAAMQDNGKIMFRQGNPVHAWLRRVGMIQRQHGSVYALVVRRTAGGFDFITQAKALGIDLAGNGSTDQGDTIEPPTETHNE